MAPPTDAPSRHVLLVDDEQELLDLFAEVLREAGCEVQPANNPRAALGQLGKQPFDVVVSDIMMPGLTGIELLRAVRARDPELPVILMTGSPTVETAIQALEHGAVQYLVKPVASADLVAAVTRAVRLRRIALLRREALSYLRNRLAPVDDRETLEASLTRALGLLWMAYQPIVSARDGSLFGYEALVRSDEAALPHPGALFEAAERLGRVVEVGRAIRNRVAAGLDDGTLGQTVFVNLHALDLTDDNLLSPDAPLSRWAKRVVLEVTERASLDAIPDARSRVRALRELGFRVAVDDLGAGYAGLASFAALEPDIVKLDIALVRGVDSEPVKRKLIGSMVSLCRDLGILVVAEGIETVGERDALRELDCDLLQGFLFGRPARQPATAIPWPVSSAG